MWGLCWKTLFGRDVTARDLPRHQLDLAGQKASNASWPEAKSQLRTLMPTFHRTERGRGLDSIAVSPMHDSSARVKFQPNVLQTISNLSSRLARTVGVSHTE